MLGRNIRYLRKKYEMSQDKLADILGYKSFTTIQKWESEKSEPPMSVLKKLSDLFNVDMNDLATVDLSAPKERKIRSVEIPIVGRVAGGEPLLMVEEIEGREEIPKRLAQTGTFVAMRIHGESMSPRICDGDLVIVKEQQDADDGQIVIAAVNGDDATCKKIRRRNGQICLMSFNPAYPPQWYMPDEVEIKGLVVELRAKM